LLKEIDEFNSLIERVLKGLSGVLPKSIIDDINNTPGKEEVDHAKLISFSTKVDVITEFFNEESERLERSLIEAKKRQDESSSVVA
jgi:hypothetical protein